MSNKQETNLGPGANTSRYFYPGEELALGQMRVTLIGTGWGNVVGPTQKGPSVFVELGIENPDPVTNPNSFVFDVGPGCILNYNAMGIPMSRLNHIFLSHLHMDHCSDLPFIYSFGPNLGDRYTPLNIYGPSGPDWIPTNADPTEGYAMGTKNMIEGMKQFTRWHTTSFATLTKGAEESYALTDSVRELPYQVCGGVAFDSKEFNIGDEKIRITHFPAVHIIDGAISYRLEWTPKGCDKPIVFVYSGDTQPNDFMLQYGNNADLMVHETAPSVQSIMDSAGSSESEALAIVCNSHTPAESLGAIFNQTQPKLGVTTHTPMDPRFIDEMIAGVRKNWTPTATNPAPYQIGADLMVFNISRDDHGETQILTRTTSPIERPWPVRVSETPTTPPPLAAETPAYQEAVAENTDLDEKPIFKYANLSDTCQAYIEDPS